MKVRTEACLWLIHWEMDAGGEYILDKNGQRIEKSRELVHSTSNVQNIAAMSMPRQE